MNVLVIPDEAALDHPGPDRIAIGLRARLGDDVEITFGLVPAQRGHAALAAAGIAVMPLDDAIANPAFDAWVMALSFVPIYHGEGGWERVLIPGTPEQRQGKQIWALEPDALMHPVTVTDGHADVSLTRDANPHIDRNVFSRMGPRDFRGGAYLFPYNGFYCVHTRAWGPIDEFGFRNAVDLKTLEGRDPNHIVIAVLGGSSAFSPCCLHHEMFANVLERKLDGYRKEHDLPLRFTVVNFGVSGFTVLNQTITYLLFGHRLQPDIVIAHDLFNDLANSIQTDPDLLNRHDITYMSAFEDWS